MRTRVGPHADREARRARGAPAEGAVRAALGEASRRAARSRSLRVPRDAGSGAARRGRDRRRGDDRDPGLHAEEDGASVTLPGAPAARAHDVRAAGGPASVLRAAPGGDGRGRHAAARADRDDARARDRAHEVRLSHVRDVPHGAGALAPDRQGPARAGFPRPRRGRALRAAHALSPTREEVRERGTLTLAQRAVSLDLAPRRAARADRRADEGGGPRERRDPDRRHAGADPDLVGRRAEDRPRLDLQGSRQPLRVRLHARPCASPSCSSRSSSR